MVAFGDVVVSEEVDGGVDLGGFAAVWCGALPLEKGIFDGLGQGTNFLASAAVVEVILDAVAVSSDVVVVILWKD